MRDVFIVGYLRTPISRTYRDQPERDVFYNVRPDELAAIVIKELINRAKIDPQEVDECIMGSARMGGVQWSYGGRLISLRAGLPFETAGIGVDRQCASAMTAINIGFMEIALGISDTIIAGGYEHMSRLPIGVGVDIDPKLFEAEKRFDWWIALNMGLTAEKLAEESGITAREMAEWSCRSHMLAWKAYSEGYFKDEIIPIEITLPDGSKQVIDRDLSIRSDTSVEKILSLPPAFKPGGVINAGNSSPLNTGAAAVLLMSRERMEKYGLKPLAKIKGYAYAGVDPSVMGKGPVPATRKLLSKYNLKVKDIDYWEINEAFAVVTLYAVKELKIDPNKVNIKGGAIAIGHPLGMTGARLIGTLARILKIHNGNLGVATLCVGGGQGVATLIENVD